jgi:hypothetical protein
MPYSFKAYPVREGDAFFVNDEGFKFLIDGGDDDYEITNFLVSDGVRAIDVVICTHLDSDHVNGILGLLQSGSISVRELWVPEAWPQLISLIGMDSGGFKGIVKQAADANSEALAENTAGTTSIDDVLVSDPVRSGYSSHRRQEDAEINDRVLGETEGATRTLVNEYGRYLIENDRKFISGLASAVAIIRTASRHRGPSIKYWRFVNTLQNTPMRDFICLNGVPVTAPAHPYTATSLSGLPAVLALTRINRESLVYCYEPARKPHVLFTADSGFGFLPRGSSVNLPKASIMTAPHHGSGDKAHQRVFMAVGGTGLNYVRSDSINAVRPAGYFLSTPITKRFCTNCKKDNFTQTVEFDYGTAGFSSGARSCPYGSC